MQKSVKTLIIDQFDSGDFQKTAATIQGNDYALIIREGTEYIKKFPVNTPEETASSVEAFKKNASAIPDELSEIAKARLQAANVFHFQKKAFDEDVFSTANLVNAQRIDWHAFEKKMAATGVEEDVFAYSDGKKDYYNITTPELLTKGMMWYEKNAGKLSIEQRRTVAVNMMKRAEKLGCDATPYIQKSAGRYISPMAVTSIQARALRCKNRLSNGEESFSSYKKLAEDVKAKRMKDPEELCQKLASIDRTVPVSIFMDLDDAYDTVFHDKSSEESVVKSAGIDLELAQKVLTEKGLDSTIDNLTPIEKAALRGSSAR